MGTPLEVVTRFAPNSLPFFRSTKGDLARCDLGLAQVVDQGKSVLLPA